MIASPAALAQGYIGAAVPTEKDALTGARDILVEELGENAALVGRLLEARERLVAANIGEPIAGPCWPQGRFVGRA